MNSTSTLAQRALRAALICAFSLWFAACANEPRGDSEGARGAPTAHADDEVGETSRALSCPTGPFFPSCAGHCGFQTCSPASLPDKPICCACDEGCTERGDCCCDYTAYCAPAAPAASCEGHCGGASPGGCYCDTACTGYGDCCSDYTSVCSAGSCVGHCGGRAPEGCYCDSACSGYGDCCGDYAAVCGRSVVQVAAGGRQTCARFSDGNVRCWGHGQYGVLGYASVSDVRVPSSAPSDVSLGGTATQIVTGYYHTCALLSGGGVRCWGRNDVGQLGYPGHGDVGDDESPASMPLVNVGGTVTALAAGTKHTCARLSTGAVKCWGQGLFGALGYGNTANVGDDESPASVSSVPVGASVTSIAAGGFHTCARLSSGTTRCWGANGFGQLGYGQVSGTWAQIGDNETPASVGDVPLGGSASTYALNDSNTCALFSGGSVKCWGAGSAYLGYGTTVNLGDDETVASLPSLALGAATAEVVSGASHHCVRMTTGSVRCWGYISGGGLGYASTSPISSASAAGNVSLGGSAVQLSAGYGHVCALLSSGGLRCWGAEGALGYAAAGAVGDDETPASMGDISIF